MVKPVLEHLTKGLPGRVTVPLPGSVSKCHRDINKEVRGFLRHTVHWFVRVLEPGPTELTLHNMAASFQAIWGMWGSH